MSFEKNKEICAGRGWGPDEVKPALHSELIHVQSHCRPIIPCTTKLPDKRFFPQAITDEHLIQSCNAN